ncbi:MAG: hypothetical protein WD894_14325 [Pirellulales bacterium]
MTTPIIPHHETLDRLIEAGVYRIIQTSWGTTQGVIPPEVRRHLANYQGDIVVTTEGSGYEVSTSRTFPTDE